MRRSAGGALAPGAGFEGGRPLGLRREVGGATGIANWEMSDSLRLTAITAEFASVRHRSANKINKDAAKF